MRAYKCLTSDGLGVFSRFPWPLPSGTPGSWVESNVATCQSGIHACRSLDLPFWLTPVLYEIELDGPVDEPPMKLVAPRGRLLRRIDAWDDESRLAYAEMCIARAGEMVADAPPEIAAWAATPEQRSGGPAPLGFMAAKVAELLGGPDAYLNERRRQSEWLVEHLALD
jgi:hypothetical protein